MTLGSGGGKITWRIYAPNPQIGERRAPLAPPLEQRTRIPGVEATAARASLAEIGTAMRHVGSAARLASWSAL